MAPGHGPSYYSGGESWSAPVCAFLGGIGLIALMLVGECRPPRLEKAQDVAIPELVDSRGGGQCVILPAPRKDVANEEDIHGH